MRKTGQQSSHCRYSFKMTEKGWRSGGRFRLTTRSAPQSFRKTLTRRSKTAVLRGRDKVGQDYMRALLDAVFVFPIQGVCDVFQINFLAVEMWLPRLIVRCIASSPLPRRKYICPSHPFRFLFESSSPKTQLQQSRGPLVRRLSSEFNTMANLILQSGEQPSSGSFGVFLLLRDPTSIAAAANKSILDVCVILLPDDNILITTV